MQLSELSFMKKSLYLDSCYFKIKRDINKKVWCYEISYDAVNFRLLSVALWYILCDPSSNVLMANQTFYQDIMMYRCKKKTSDFSQKLQF